MLILTSKTPWQRRPSGMVEIDRSSPLSTGLVGAWAMTEGSGATLRNLAGRHNDLTHSGTGEWSSSDLGIVANSGLNTYWRSTSVTGTPLEILSNAQRTYAAWVRTTDATLYQTILQQADSFTGVVSRLTGDAGGSQFEFVPYYTGSSGVKTASVRSGDWYLVVGTHDGTNATCYVNGVAGTPASNSGSPTYGTGNLTIGNLDGGNTGFGGQMAGVFVWSRCLSDAEVYAIYAPSTRWSLYQPIVRKAYFDLAGGGGGGGTRRISAGMVM